MVRYIAILRGINVGTGRKVPMADLKSLCGKLGLLNVQTYIQSGNVVFELPQNKPLPELEACLQKAFSETFSFDIPVIGRTSGEWLGLVAQNPFLKEENPEVDRLHLTCLKEMPSPEALEKIKTFQYLPDRYAIVGREVFVFCSNGYGKTKIANDFFEKKLGVVASTRNWKTVMKLHEMLESN